MRARTPLEVLAKHQFPESPDDGGCTARDGWGLCAGGEPDNQQMAEHQLEMLEQAGFTVVRQGAST